MARRVDYARYEGVQTETAAQARRRRQRERSNEVTERAEYLLENDPDIDTMLEARRAAREQIDAEREYEAGVRKGTVDPNTGKSKSRAARPKRSAGRNSRPAATRAKHRSHRSSRPSRRAARFARKTARAVVEPYGSVGAAGWTLVTGSLSVILLYVLLQEAGTVKAFTNALSGGIRRLSDPFMPLIPTAAESAPPRPKKKPVQTTGGPKK